jgi:hypothetical protein
MLMDIKVVSSFELLMHIAAMAIFVHGFWHWSDMHFV